MNDCDFYPTKKKITPTRRESNSWLLNVNILTLKLKLFMLSCGVAIENAQVTVNYLFSRMFTLRIFVVIFSKMIALTSDKCEKGFEVSALQLQEVQVMKDPESYQFS